MSQYIEGKRAVLEALRTDVPIKCIIMADNLEHDSLVKDILRKAGNAGVDVNTVPRKKLDSIALEAAKDAQSFTSGAKRRQNSRSKHGEQAFSHQGVMAETKPFKYASLKDILCKCSDGGLESALIVVCDHITDAGNLGAVIRSAECVGALCVVIPNKRSAQVIASTYKTSAGAVSHIPIVQVPNIAAALEDMKDCGFWVAAATEKADTCIWDSNLKGKVALVLGSEGDGISRLVLERCDFPVALPQAGKISSLNVAQSATACMYEWMRQNRVQAG